MNQENNQIQLEPSWKNKLQEEFEKDYMKNLKSFLQIQKTEKKDIFPLGSEYFAALNLTPFDKVKIVIMGQDPYHGPRQAHGLAFSVKPGTPLPPSLKNIFKELQSDLGIAVPNTGNLERWGQQGVLLLNSVLTVEDGKAAAHQKKGWEQFTNKIIEVVNENCDHVVFILWGAYAQKKAAFVDRKKHLILESVHPSPLSSHRGFFGSKPFSKTNVWLKSKGLKPIQW